MILNIYLNSTLVGNLQSIEGGLRFSYDNTYVSSPNAHPISLSLPLSLQPQPIRQTERFFNGLLPEGDERKKIARYLGVSSTSTAKMLAALAGDCVGNLTLLDEGHSINQLVVESGYEPLSDADFEAIVENSADAIARISTNNRMSIPGAQPKIGLFSETDIIDSTSHRWFLPKGLTPSTHILKPSLTTFAHSALNEHICTMLAKACGLKAAATSIINHDGNSVLITQRFDRLRLQDGSVMRLSQEDFCQALSIAPENKYQADGGPGLDRIFGIVRMETSDPIASTGTLAGVVLFNYLIGNCDAHAKNYSLQRTLNGDLQLAPAYDIVSTTYYPTLSRNMAMGINNVYAIDRVTADDFVAMCTKLGMSWKSMKAEGIRMAQAILENADNLVAQMALIGFEEQAEILVRHIEEGVLQRSSNFS
jgi:serine/threonine-protein kinase HipA